MDQTGNIKPGEWRSVVSDTDTGALVWFNRVRGSCYIANGIQILEALTDYFNFELGEVALAVGICKKYWPSCFIVVDICVIIYA